MARAGSLFRGGNGPDVVGQACCDRFEHRKAGRVNAVVVGQEDTHDTAMRCVRPWDNHLRLPRNNPQLIWLEAGQSLLSMPALTMSALGIPAYPL